jgi:hypothetical protein
MRSAWLRSSMRPRSDFPVAEFSDLKGLIPYGGAQVVAQQVPSSGVVGIARSRVSRPEPDGGCYGWFSANRVTHETRHVYLHETYQPERGRRDRRPPKGGSSPNPSASDARATPQRTASPRCHDRHREIRLGDGAPIGTRRSRSPKYTLPTTQEGQWKPTGDQWIPTL